MQISHAIATPVISVIMPARNEADRLLGTLRSIAYTRSSDTETEIVIVDDASTDGCCSNLASEGSKIVAPKLKIRVIRFDERVGVARARNHGAYVANGDILFITDAHVRFCQGWDCLVLENIKENRSIAATIADPASFFKGYGCNLVVPFMGTRWNKNTPHGVKPVQIPVSSGTILKKNLFEKIGGFDPGMIYYGAAEPEFGVRLWLSGAEVVSVPQLEVLHRFKPKAELNQFIGETRPFMLHNNLRFGLLYLSELASLQMIRHLAMKFPKHIHKALTLIENSDVWERRKYLESQLKYDFNWFVKQFNLKDQIGQDILL